MLPIPNLGAHGMSKIAGVKLFDYIQAENPDLHIVNTQPGSVDTEMSRQAGQRGKDHRKYSIQYGLHDALTLSADLAGQFAVWLASPEAAFLKGKFVWTNWDVDELKARAEEIQTSRLLTIMLEGVAM